MSRYGSQSQDAQGVQAEFTRGVVFTRPGDRLPEGFYKRLINGEIRNGYPETRRGARTLPWLRNTNGTPLGTTWQAIQEFRPSKNDFTTSPRLMLMIVDDDFWVSAPNNVPQRFHTDITSDTQPCEIIPAFNVALILRNVDQVPLLFDLHNSVPSGAFFGTSGILRSLPTPTTGIVLPAAETGCYHAGRIWLKYGYDQIIASDIYEWRYTSSNIYRVESGGNGELVRLWPYGEKSIAAFKNDSVIMIRNATGDLSDIDLSNRVYGSSGCVAADSIQQIGDQIYYLSPNGVEVLQVTGDSLIVQPAESFSRNISPYFKGLSWPAAAGARGLIVDNYYILAIPSTATWRQVDPLAVRWGGADPVVDGFTPGDGVGPLNGNIGSLPNEMAVQSDGKVVVVGSFTEVNSAARSYIVRLNANGTTDDSFNPVVDSAVVAVRLQGDGKIVIAGAFASVNGEARNRIARLNADGSLDTSFNPNADAAVYSLLIASDGNIYAGGLFSMMGAVATVGVAKISSGGVVDSGWVSDIEAGKYVQALAIQSDGKLVIAGNFTTVDSNTHYRCARLNTDGSEDTSFTADLEAGATPGEYGSALAIDGSGNILIGGFFTQVNATTVRDLVRVDATGAVDTGFLPNPQSNSPVHAILIQSDGRIVIAGAFTALNGSPSTRIARLENADGATDNTFSTSADAVITGMTESSMADIFICGGFTDVAGETRVRIARMDADGNLN